MSKQQLSTKKLKKCSSIIGQPVIAAFANGYELPHDWWLAWVTRRDAYIVNARKRVAKKFIVNSTYAMCRFRLKTATAAKQPDINTAIVTGDLSNSAIKWSEAT